MDFQEGIAIKGLIVGLVLILARPAFSQNGHSFETYQTTFLAFVKTVNPSIPIDGALELGALNWDVAGGKWATARRLASMENLESGHFKVAGWMDYQDLPAKKLWPRYDCMGSHLNLIFQEAKRLGLANGRFDVHSDETDKLIGLCSRDPAFGTWLVAHAYVHEAKKVGLDRASHWWQTGKSWFSNGFDYRHDLYLQNVWRGEALFDTLIPGAPRKVAPTKRWRKR